MVLYHLRTAALTLSLLAPATAWATPATVSVVLPPLPALTNQGLPQVDLGYFSFGIGTAFNLVNNDIPETVYNLAASASSKYTSEYYACGTARTGGGCSSVPSTLTATRTNSATPPSIFRDGESALANFTFTYEGALSFSVTATNQPAQDRYSVTLSDENG